MNFLKNYFLGKKFRQLQQQHQKLMGHDKATALLARSCANFMSELAGSIEAKTTDCNFSALSKAMTAEIIARLTLLKKAPVRFREKLVRQMREAGQFRVIMRVESSNTQSISLRADNGIICEMRLPHEGQAFISGLKLWSDEMVFSAHQNPDLELLAQLTHLFWKDQLFAVNLKSSKKEGQKIYDAELLSVKALKPNADTQTPGHAEYLYLVHDGTEIYKKTLKQNL